MDKYLSENKKLKFCFADLRKAYDSIWCEAPYKKLSCYQVRTNCFSLLKNMFEKIKLSVRLPRGISKLFPSNVVGLKQGCNMSSIFFNLFINDIDKIFDERFCRPAIKDILKPNNLLSVDDLITKTRADLQSCWDNLQAYWKTTVNNKKSNNMVVEKRQSRAQMHHSILKSLLKFVSYVYIWELL